MSHYIGEMVTVLNIPDSVPDDEYLVGWTYEVISITGKKYELATSDESDSYMFNASDIGYADV